MLLVDDGRVTCTPKPAEPRVRQRASVRPRPDSPTGSPEKNQGCAGSGGKVLKTAEPRGFDSRHIHWGTCCDSVLSCSTCDRPVTSTLVYHENGVVFAPSLFPEGPREESQEAICIDSLHPATRCIRMHLVGGAPKHWIREFHSSLAALPGRSEQNRLSPPPRVNDDAGISPFWE